MRILHGSSRGSSLKFPYSNCVHVFTNILNRDACFQDISFQDDYAKCLRSRLCLPFYERILPHDETSQYLLLRFR